MFSYHRAKSCKLLHITLQPYRLKKVTGLPSTPLKEKKNPALCLLTWSICLLFATTPRPHTGPWACLWYFPSLFKKTERVKMTFRMDSAWLGQPESWAHMWRLVFFRTIHNVQWREDIWKPPVEISEAWTTVGLGWGRRVQSNIWRDNRRKHTRSPLL